MATAAATLAAPPASIPPPAAAPAPSAAAPPSAAPGLPQAPPVAGWWDSVKDPAVKEWLGGKKYPDADSALQAHWGLERLLGADKAGRTVVLPKDDADVEGLKAFNAKIGVPEKADGYTLPVPEGQGAEFAKTAANWFHEAGVPPKAATKIVERWNEFMKEHVATSTAADTAESEKQMGALQSEWGAAYDGNKEMAQRGYRDFAKKFGLDDKATLERAESVFGAANLTRFFAGIGNLNSESTFAGSGGNKGPGFSISAAEAKTAHDAIIADRSSGKINDHAWRTEYQAKAIALGRIFTGK